MRDSAYWRGVCWMVCKFGLRRTVHYERARRSGVTINYAEIFTPSELARLADAGLLPGGWRWGGRL